jgi:hypothetical protein
MTNRLFTNRSTIEFFWGDWTICALKYHRKPLRAHEQEPRVTARPPQKSSRAIRIAFLLLATAALSWYSRQQQNNPFSHHESISLIATNQATYLKISLDKDTAISELLILLGQHSSIDARQPIPCPKPWILVSFSADSGVSRLFSTPPAEWFHLGHPLPKTSLPAQGLWPSPQQLSSLQLNKKVLIQRLPQSDAISGSVGGISFLYSLDTSLNCTPGLKSTLLENIDVVFTSGPLASIEQIRSCVRPYHLFVLPPWSGVPSESSPSNIHRLTPPPCGYAIVDKGSRGVSLKPMKFENVQSRRL